MRAKFTLLTLMVAALFTASAQQIPNGGFESWSSAVSPASWTSIEDLLGLSTNIFTYKDSVDFVQGAASLKLVSDSLSLEPQAGVIGGIISLGTGALVGNSISFHGVPFTSRPDTLEFEYQLTSPGTDTAVIEIILTKGGVTQVLGAEFLLTETNVWSPVNIPLAQFYDTAGVLPDTLIIQFQSSHKAPVKGTTLHVDAMRFGYVPAPPPSLVATINTTGGLTAFCNGDSLVLNANTGTGYTYQWALDSTAIAGATSASYAAKAGGWYNVTIDSAGVHALSQPFFVTDSDCTTGIHYIASANVTVYPNPATNYLSVNANISLGAYNLQGYDLTGRLVISRLLEDNNNVIDIAKLGSGVYLLRIANEQSEVILQQKVSVIK